MKTRFDDTIAAISSPLGQGGIGIIRMAAPGPVPFSKNYFGRKRR